MIDYRGCSSVGRALAWHARGRQFESDQLHQIKTNLVIRKVLSMYSGTGWDT